MARPKKNVVAVEPTQYEVVVDETRATPDVAEAAKEAPTFSEEQVQKMIAEAVAKAMANQVPQQPHVVQIAADVEKLHFLWMAQVADDNTLSIGGQNSGYAPITGKYGEFVIPKSDLSRVMDEQFRGWLKKRWLIIVDGMSDEERKIYGVDYKDGELLDKMAFNRLVELEDKILPIYPKLCAGHREMVAKCYYEAYMNKNPHVRRDVVVALNDMSIELGSKNGDFDPIIEVMNEADRKRKH